VRVHFVVPDILERAAMIFVRSGLADNADDPSASAAVLSRHGVGKDLEFLCSVYGKVGERSRRIANLVVRGAIDEKRIQYRLAAADVDSRRAPGGQDLSSKVSDPSDRWDKVGKPHRIAAVQRQVFYLLTVHNGAKRGGIGFEQNGATDHLDGIGHLTD